MNVSAPALLQIAGLHKSFGGVQAVQGLSLQLHAGRSEERRVGKEC